MHSPILPERLRRAVAEDVLATYQVEAAARAGDAGGLHLDRIWADLRRRWVTLISSCPELLEAYTSSDADGRTVRRYAFVDEEEVPAGHGSATGAPDGTGADLGDRAREGASLAAAAAGLTLGEGRGAGPASLPAASTQLPAQLAADVRWAEVRYRAACQVFWRPGGRPGPGQCRPPSAGQRSLLSMLLDLTPADPDWPAGAMLHLSLSVEAAAGEDGQPSVRVSGLTCSGSTHLTGLESTALQRLVQALLLQEGGARLQSALRTLENGGGGLLRSARCIAAEVERRRAAAGGKADGGAGTADQADNPGVVDSAAGSDDSPRDSSREGGEGSGSDVEGAEAGGGPGPGKTGDRSSMQGGRPVLLRLGGLQLAGCDALEALTLIMQVGGRGAAVRSLGAEDPGGPPGLILRPALGFPPPLLPPPPLAAVTEVPPNPLRLARWPAAAAAPRPRWRWPCRAGRGPMRKRRAPAATHAWPCTPRPASCMSTATCCAGWTRRGARRETCRWAPRCRASAGTAPHYARCAGSRWASGTRARAGPATAPSASRCGGCKERGGVRGLEL